MRLVIVIEGLPEQFKKQEEKASNEVRSLSNSKYDVFAVSSSNITDRESRVVYAIICRVSCSPTSSRRRRSRPAPTTGTAGGSAWP